MTHYTRCAGVKELQILQVPGNTSGCAAQRFGVMMSVCLSLMLALQENLRQLCVFQLANESGQSYRWWEYVTKFGEECTMSGNNYNEDCAERVCQFCNACDTLKLGQPKSVVNVVPTVVHSALRLFVWICHASLQWQPLLCTHPDCTLSVLVCVSWLSLQRKERVTNMDYHSKFAGLPPHRKQVVCTLYAGLQ